MAFCAAEAGAHRFLPHRGGIGFLVSRVNDNADFFDARREDFFNDDPQRGFGNAVTVYERL